MFRRILLDSQRVWLNLMRVSRVSESIRPLITVLGHKVAELLKQLGGRSQSAKQEEEYQKCAPATGDWLLNMEQYLKWKISRNNLLWIKGAGKWLPQY